MCQQTWIPKHRAVGYTYCFSLFIVCCMLLHYSAECWSGFNKPSFVDSKYTHKALKIYQILSEVKERWLDCTFDWFHFCSSFVYDLGIHLHRFGKISNFYDARQEKAEQSYWLVFKNNTTSNFWLYTIWYWTCSFYLGINYNTTNSASESLQCM